MGTPKIPYTIQAGIAASVNNDEAVLTIMQSCMPKLLQSFLRTGSKISMTLRAGVLNGPLSWDRQLDCSKKSARL